ncbi:MAG: MarR family transcriptional regulator [Mesorhizobium sp.]
MSGKEGLLTLADVEEPEGAYHLQDQVGFLLRKANQRHLAIFAARISDLTPPQFAVLAKLHEVGDTSQNQLGNLVAMDAATVKGVIDRLKARGLVGIGRHEADRRRLLVSLTAEGRAVVERLFAPARAVSRETLAPLSPREASTLVRLLARIS